ncbi:acyl carrier protein [Actinomadura harenae]|uniref:Acyl carrier protein n=1 Tax=Actinomadura harenae TaxID=2483351 RepID=A0A3M2LM99_9ACTN|nr:acyl carrier protein [Actinomadura harenae]RMI38567.1 acyl carrier protein [Actinomadura harenae]
MTQRKIDADEVLTVLRSTLEMALPQEYLKEWDLDAIVPETPMVTLALDSLALMVVIEEIETEFGVGIPVESVYAFTSVGDLVGYVLAS